LAPTPGFEDNVYAIVKTGGKQYRVERGQRLLVERLPEAEGAQIALQPLLYRSDEAVLDAAGLESVQVTAKVIEHVRGEKLRVFKFKPKRGYRRRTGHRQQLTRIEVTEIAAGGKRKAAPAGADAVATDAADARATPAAAKKPAAKKPAAAKAKAGTAAKKPAAAKAGGGAKAGEDTKARAKAGESSSAGEKKAPAKPRTKPRKDDDGS
jgi:large subunit ribosomal protein L21